MISLGGFGFHTESFVRRRSSVRICHSIFSFSNVLGKAFDVSMPC